MHSIRGSRACAAVFVLWLVCVVTLSIGVSAAYAGQIKYWTGIQPKGTAGTNLPVTIRGNCAPDGYALVPASARLYVDGVLVPRTSYTASIFASSASFYYLPSPVLSDGTHTFRVEVADAAGKLSFNEWSARIAQPPASTWLAPAAGSSCYDGRPAISLLLSDNTPDTTFTVVGQVRWGSSSGPVVDTFGGAGLSAGVNDFAPSAELAPGTYYLTATVTDGAGNARVIGGTAARGFVAVAQPAMSLLGSCDSCHPTLRTAHPTPATTDCQVCHEGYGGDHMEGTEDCFDCHTDGWHTNGAKTVVVVRSSCLSCHTPERPAVPQHTAASTAPAHQSSCGGCHVSSLTARHAVAPAGSPYPYQCDVCHASTSPAVVAAIASGDASCAACHAGHDDVDALHTFSAFDVSCQAAGCHSQVLTTEHARFTGAGKRYEQYPDSCTLCHANEDGDRVPESATLACASCHEDLDAGHLAMHSTTTSTTVLAGTAKVCADCHSSNMMTEHVKPSASSASAGCEACHPSPRSTIVEHDDATCVQAGCHADGSPSAMHNGMSADHAFADPAPACFGSGCHEGADLADIHSEASTTTPAGTQTACAVCHYSGVPSTGDCGTCHPDRLAPHGYEPADHMADATCVSQCHAPAAGMTELKPLHDAAKGSEVTCGSCHATKVPELASAYPPGWDKTCTQCHAVAGLHPAAASSHAGTDIAYQGVSYFANGCSTATGIDHTPQSACHDISDVALLHSRMPASGCVACHGPGKTPSQECYSCHKPGYATSYTVPGTPSANIVANGYPSAVDSISAEWTWTTTPAGQPINQVVDAPYPPSTTTEFVTVTSPAAGGVLFGWNRPSVPANARITDVRIYAKATTANTTYPRRMQGVFKIGGQSYPTSLSGNLGTAWPTGTGTGFATTSTRIDYTREPLYGEMIWRNPKTGQDWTPAELNGTDLDSSLDAFGINVTASTSANNVSLTQIYVKVTYYTVGPNVTNPTVGTHIYHGNNVKYLHDPSDVPAGQRFAVNPSHGWYEALYYQDCYDICHRGNGGDPTFSANQGEWMWYSVGGDPGDTAAATRTLTLRPVTLPAEATTLRFDTNYRLGSGAAGYVEISTDDGGSWTPLTGAVGGSGTASITGNAAGWVPASYDLSAYAGSTVRLRFRYVNGASVSEGWAFDSLSISGPAGTVFSDDAETLKPDWSNRFWTRAKGAFPLQ